MIHGGCVMTFAQIYGEKKHDFIEYKSVQPAMPRVLSTVSVLLPSASALQQYPRTRGLLATFFFAKMVDDTQKPPAQT